MLQLLIQVFPNWLCHIEDLMRLDEQRVLACAEKRQRGECEASRGLAAPTGRCQWRQSRDTGYPQCPWIQYTALTILLWSCFCHSKGQIVSLYYLCRNISKLLHLFPWPPHVPRWLLWCHWEQKHIHMSSGLLQWEKFEFLLYFFVACGLQYYLVRPAWFCF